MTATLQTFREIAPGVHVLNEDLRLLGMEFGHRTTAVRLASGGLWLHSPVRLGSQVLTGLERLGEVEHLVAPSRMHDLYLGEWLEALPDATSWAPPSLRAAHPEWSFDADLGGDPAPDWEQELARLHLAGQPKIDEHVFLHRASGTLIVADLLFNLVGEQRPLPGLLMRALGARGPGRTSRLFRSMIRDRAAFRASIAQLLEWDFERVIVGHGELVEGDAVREARRTLEGL